MRKVGTILNNGVDYKPGGVSSLHKTSVLYGNKTV